MKRNTLFLFFCCFMLAAYKQQDNDGSPVACITPADCTLDLRDSMYTDAQIDTVTLSYAKTGTSPRFHDVRYATETCDFTPDTTYCADSTSVLQYHVYYPNPAVHNYKSCKLPLLIFFHGGGFLDCGGTFDGPDIVALCRQFARRGFVVMSGEYRRGVIVASNTIYTAQQFLGVYRSAQDGRGLTRTAIKRERQATEPYRIDTTQIFIGGASAGSVVALSVAYFSNQSMFDAVHPGISNSNVLGGINPTFYYGDTSIKYKIRGVVNLWGGLAIPPGYLSHPEDFFRQDDTIPPMISFQGYLDPTFKPAYKKVFFSKDFLEASGINYGKEGHCLLYDTAHYVIYPKGGTAVDGYLLGEQNIYIMLRKLCKPSEYYLDSQMHHGLDTTTNSSLYKSDFGTGATNTATTGVYIVQRACTFMQAILNNKAALLTTTKFFECENYRYSCNIKDTNNHCPVTDSLICP